MQPAREAASENFGNKRLPPAKAGMRIRLNPTPRVPFRFARFTLGYFIPPASQAA